MREWILNPDQLQLQNASEYGICYDLWDDNE